VEPCGIYNTLCAHLQRKQSKPLDCCIGIWFRQIVLVNIHNHHAGKHRHKRADPVFKLRLNMALVNTTKGPMEEELLQKTEGSNENLTEIVRWVEYRHEGELVHRSVDLTLKDSPV
jgi:hypothetical protein